MGCRSCLSTCLGNLDKQYAYSVHGLLDALKITFNFIAWISLATVPYLSGLLSFVLSCLISDFIWGLIRTILQGWCMDWIKRVCCCIDYRFGLFLINLFWMILDGVCVILAGIGMISYSGENGYVALCVEITFLCFVMVLHGYHAYIYYTERKTDEPYRVFGSPQVAVTVSV